MVTFYNTLVQNHNQNLDITTVRIQNIPITTRISLVPFYSHTHFLLPSPPP